METNIFIFPDFLDGNIIKGPIVRRKAGELVVFLNANRNKCIVCVTTSLEMAFVQVHGPCSVSINLCLIQAVLEGNDVSSGNIFWRLMRPLYHGMPESSWEQCSEEHEGAFEKMHDVTGLGQKLNDRIVGYVK